MDFPARSLLIQTGDNDGAGKTQALGIHARFELDLASVSRAQEAPFWRRQRDAPDIIFAPAVGWKSPRDFIFSQAASRITFPLLLLFPAAPPAPSTAA